jgi:hypothetical protein
MMIEYMVRIMVVILACPFIFSSTVHADVSVLVVDGRFAPVNNGPRISSACCPAQSASQQADPPVKVWA